MQTNTENVVRVLQWALAVQDVIKSGDSELLGKLVQNPEAVKGIALARGYSRQTIINTICEAAREFSTQETEQK